MSMMWMRSSLSVRRTGKGNVQSLLYLRKRRHAAHHQLPVLLTDNELLLHIILIQNISYDLTSGSDSPGRGNA